jgi:hypothetical protein
MAPPSALPIGATRVVSEMQPVQVDPSQAGSGLLNRVLALLAPPHPDESERYDEEILDLNVACFLVVYVWLLVLSIPTHQLIVQDQHRCPESQIDHPCAHPGIVRRESGCCRLFRVAGAIDFHYSKSILRPKYSVGTG